MTLLICGTSHFLLVSFSLFLCFLGYTFSLLLFTAWLPQKSVFASHSHSANIGLREAPGARATLWFSLFPGTTALVLKVSTDSVSEPQSNVLTARISLAHPWNKH